MFPKRIIIFANGDLPDPLSRLEGYNPVNSSLTTSAIVLILVVTGNIVQIAAFTSLTILVYYAITNLSSLRLPSDKRLYPRAISITGLISCLGLTAFLPLEEWMWTIALLALGAAYLLFRRKKVGTQV